MLNPTHIHIHIHRAVLLLVFGCGKILGFNSVMSKLLFTNINVGVDVNMKSSIVSNLNHLKS